MTLSKALQQFQDAAKSKDVYWIEEAKLDFALALHQRCMEADINNKLLAERMGTSQAYITKIFRGDANLTIESMVKLARALELKLNIELVDDRICEHAPQPSSWGKIPARKPTLKLVTNTSVLVENGDSSDYREAA